MRRSAISIVFVLGSLLIPGLAAAEHGANTVSFERLDGRVSNGHFRVAYEIGSESWTRFVDRDVTPHLKVWVADGEGHGASFRYSTRLETRSGHIEFPGELGIDAGDRVEFAVVAMAGSWQVEKMRHGSQLGDRLEFWMWDGNLRSHGEYDRRRRSDRRARADDRDDSASRGNDSDDDERRHHHKKRRGKKRVSGAAAVVEACKDAVISTRVDDCVRRAAGVRSGMGAEAVEACDDAFVGTSKVLDCLSATRSHRYSPSETIEACDDAFVGSSRLLDCVERTAWFRTRPVDTIDACDDAFVGSSDKLRCLDASRSTWGVPSAVVAACDDAAIGSSATLTCIEQSQRFGYDKWRRGRWYQRHHQHTGHGCQHPIHRRHRRH